MGKKGKTGKSRRDKFYHLAKETGYRARSAFKLIQLNRKFEFLQKSRVVIDLCAAPGGWLQVVAENTPVSSLIIGVDLVPIRPIPKVSTFQEDITTEKCRQTLRKELQTWKADAVLNDGAPNIGKNWLHDAFQQAELTLEALKLATDFLRKGGWFVTKVFRSKDYNALMWVFQQLFKKVHATKPQASRNESAEIFVVCEKFLAPDRIDPKFLDPKFVFKDVEDEPKQTINLIHPEKKKRQREGYAEGDYTLFHTLSASKFIQSENFTDLLAEASEIVIDEDGIAKHPATTTEIKACLSDIKVLGKKDIRNLFNWRKKIIKDTERDAKPEETETAKQGLIDETQESEDEEATLVEKLAELEEDERKALKRKLKKVRKEKTKLRHKMDMKMIIPGDKHDFADDVGLFNLKKIKNKSQLDDVEAGDSNEADALAMECEADESDDDAVLLKSGKKTVAYSRDNKDHLDMDESVSDSGEEEPEFQYDSAEDDIEFEDEEDDDDSNPLVVSLESKPNQISRRSASWFSKDSFAGLEIDEDEDLELEKMAEDYKQRGGQIIEQEKDSGMSDGSEDDDDDNDNDDETSSDSDSESDYDTAELHKQMTSKSKIQKKGKTDSKSGFEIVPAGQDLPKLDPVGLAIGAQLVQSRKRRREMIEGSYHRYMFDDNNLPDWFLQDERKHFRHQLPVSKGDIEEYKMKMKAIDARPIKKIAEAKARKKKKDLRRHERARIKAEAISETADITDRDKWQQIKQVYKKAGLLSQKKKEITYVVAKKGVGRRVKRPAGVQGPFRVVDPRMKKDKRSENKQNKGKGQKGKQKFSKSNRGKKRR